MPNRSVRHVGGTILLALVASCGSSEERPQGSGEPGSEAGTCNDCDGGGGGTPGDDAVAPAALALTVYGKGKLIASGDGTPSVDDGSDLGAITPGATASS